MTAGALREQIAIERRTPADDGAGNEIGGWRQVGRPFAARILFQKGGESVVAQRLEGRRPAIVTVRSCRATREITTDDRFRDVRSGVTFNIQAPTPSEARDFIDFLCVAGGADG